MVSGRAKFKPIPLCKELREPGSLLGKIKGLERQIPERYADKAAIKSTGGGYCR
jgi:hypothetical protein